MASSLFLAPASSSCFIPGTEQGRLTNHNAAETSLLRCSQTQRRRLRIAAKAAEGDQSTKPSSVICGNCNGNGVVLCSQCKGSGVNAVDFFNGEFKAGKSCWLCGGKMEMLCGDCNGAGFVGGFLSTKDE